jgi:protein-tyrosine-phosphatase
MTSVLFVCAANVCRSPYAAAKFRGGIDGKSEIDFYVNSAGTHAISGQEWCPIAEAAGSSEGSTKLFAEHIKDVDLLSYDLILTTGRSQRSAVLQYQPKTRAKLYTIREAALQIGWLTRQMGVLDAASSDRSSLKFDFDVDRIPSLPESIPSRWTWLVEEMNSWRGFVKEISTGSNALDILDPHESKKEVHKETFAQIDEALAGITLGILKVLNH